MDEHFPIVGIGASAGGLEALQKLVQAIPEESGLAYVIVQHLAPDHPSIMDRLLSEHTRIPVTKIVEGEPVLPDHIYVIPPGPFLTIHEGKFHLQDHLREEGVRTPINRFFTSLAQSHGRDAFAVVLSGTGSDGTLGVRAIKVAGGIAIVQESRSARFPGMPDSAAATGLVDLVLPPEAIPGRILDILEHRRTVLADDATLSMQDAITERLGDLLAALDPEGVHGFKSYKPPTLVRRILRRMSLLRQSTVEGFLKLLRTSAEERDILRKDFLIGVTEFFRDAEVYAAIEREVIGRLVASERSESIRIWVPGCATGEEAYSIAMLMVEEMEKTGRHLPCQVFGTDIDMTALRHARLGLYSAASTEHLSEERRARFFREESGAFQILPALREMCIFAPHDILSDPPFSRLDMISCRNVMIYLTGEAQHDILPRFHYGLRPGGYLLLGPSESLGRNDGLFDTVSRNARLFIRNDKAQTGYSALKDRPRSMRSHAGQRTVAMDLWENGDDAASRGDDIEMVAEQAFLNHAAPPFALVDGAGTLIYLSEEMTHHVRPARGAPNLSVDGFFAPGLRLPVQAALAEARDTGKTAEVMNVAVEVDGADALFDVMATPMPERDGAPTLLVLLEVRVRDAGDIVPGADRAADAEFVERKLDMANRQLAAMERETAENDQRLRSANEELLSMNEELQSSNEELETSREELQSINEELETINAELTENNRQLSRANSDMRNLLESTAIATLFLDPHMRVRLFTPALTELYGILDRDIGRPISDLAAKVAYPDLATDAAQVMETLQSVEREVEVEVTGQTFAVQVRPYRTVDDRLDGTVITFLDITARRHNERQLEENARTLREQYAELGTLYDSIPVGLSLVGRDMRYLRINPSLAQINGFTPAEHIGKRVDDLLPDIDSKIRGLYDRIFETGEPVLGMEIVGETPKDPGVERVWLADFFPVMDEGEVFAIGSCVQEITEQRALERKATLAAAAVVESEERLRRIFDSVPVFISMHKGPKHHYVYSNPSNTRLAGHRDLLGRSFREAFPELADGQVAQTFDTAYRTGEPVTLSEMSAVLKNPDGTEISASYYHSVVPYFDEEGEVAGVMSFAYDISEQVSARGQIEDIALRLTESEARMARLFNQAPAIISIFEGPDFTYVYVNPEHDAATGKPGKDLIGRPLREAMPELAGQGIIERFERVFATGAPLITDELAAQLEGPDGPTTYYKQIIEPWYEADGSVGGVMSFNYDITELVEARERVKTGERRLRTIQDSLRSFVGLLDTEGRLLEVNELALKRAGIARDDVIGKPFWDCWWWAYDADLQDRLKGWFTTALEGGTVREECKVRMAEGELITIDFNLTPSLDEAGRVIEVIPSGIDVTEWRAAEQRKDTLLGELQHRVKNSLATVQAIMRFSARTATSKEVLIESLQDRLAAISRTHDALTRSDWSGKSLHDILTEEVAPYAGDTAKRLRIEGPDVILSPDMALSLGLAVHELATNAAKYGALSTGRGKIRVTVIANAGILQRVEWQEQGGPPVTLPETTGFGSFLLQRVLTNDLESSVDIDYNKDGVRCRISFDGDGKVDDHDTAKEGVDRGG